ncbi:MAG TPA: deoxyribodipyrimidine photo-lyase [Hanamia sp.]|nr:deoxyribodipyrimidine photo-lyase [Hanamia sp.]
MSSTEISVCWFRRDLRVNDNAAFYHSLKSNYPVLPVFIFDSNILDKLDDKSDARVTFIYQTLKETNERIQKEGSSFLILYDKPEKAFKKICEQFNVKEIFTNHDYEPYAIERDKVIAAFLRERDIPFHTFKDQVIFEKSEVVKDNVDPYTIFTPYSKTWKKKLQQKEIQHFPSENFLKNLIQTSSFHFPSLQEIGFKESGVKVPKLNISESLIKQYDKTRNNPSLEGTSYAGVHLRFGTVSVRKLVKLALKLNEQWLNELIWREFFMQILFHFPYVEEHNFKRNYDRLEWRNDEKEFELWCKGETGYPIVDAGMRQLNQTGWMHNRVRMIVSSFLCKHLLIDWRWGEAYFAQKLLDYELASNNGNWQWAAGTGCDAAPYFRIFNPTTQIKKFDPKLVYIKRWIEEFRPGYLPEIVKHELARKRALEAYKKALDEK